MSNGISTVTGHLDAIAANQELMVAAHNARTYISEQARLKFDSLVLLKPATFWSPVYLSQLADLCQAMFLFQEYQLLEHKEIKKRSPDYKHLEWLAKRQGEKLTIIKHLQNLLQLTPTQTNGGSRDQRVKQPVNDAMRNIVEEQAAMQNGTTSADDLYAS